MSLLVVEAVRRCFADVSEESVARIASAVTTFELAPGELLCRAGDEADAVWLIVRGWMRSGHRRLGPGDLVGEEALFRGRHDADVVASRGCLLARLARADFDRIAASDAAFVRGLATSAILGTSRPKPGTTFAVALLSGTDTVERALETIGSATQRLGRFCRVDARDAARAIGGPLLAASRPHVEAWLDTLEAEHDILWLDTSTADDVWGDIASFRADHLLFAADAADSPRLRRSERGAYEEGARPVSLLLVHAAGTALPSGTNRWLDRRPNARHHHVLAGQASDLYRAARLLAGRGSGWVLSGGGALGAAHVGLIAALLERGLPVDGLGGTSAGAGIAATLAMRRDFESFHAILVEHFVRRQAMRRLTVPFISFLSRAAVDDLATSMFGDTLIEDLWVPWFGVSTDLHSGEAVVHRRGPLWRAVRASSSVPVAVAPVVEDGRVLVDGGLVDNLPVDVMARICGGPVIGSDLAVPGGPAPGLQYGDLPRGRDLFRRGRRPSSREQGRPSQLPTIAHALEQLIVLGSRPRAAAQAAACAWHFAPDLRGYTAIDYPRFGDIARAGYRQARMRIVDRPLGAFVSGWAADTPASHVPPEDGIFERFGLILAR